MATIGQVVYNLQDFHSSIGLISTDEKNLSGTISSTVKNEKTGKYEANPLYPTNKINIFGKASNDPAAGKQDIVQKFGGGPFVKLGIQAPPGTKVKLNSNKTIIIGRTGVYELDEDIRITALQFERPKKYIVDNIATEQSLNEGIDGFEQAESDRKTKLEDLDNRYVDKDKDVAYWAEYKEIQDAYEEVYSEAQSKYIAGINGIYVLPNSANPDADENYEELYNVIIDFLY